MINISPTGNRSINKIEVLFFNIHNKLSLF